VSQLPTVIKFFAPIIDVTTNALMDVFDRKLREGKRDFILLVSCPGGSVFHGLSAYNYLKGLPAQITTHNFGSVDSIGVILFCGGSTRLSVPQARFLLHGVSSSFQANMNLEEKQLEERLKSLRIDTENIAKVISATTGKSIEDVVQAMLDRATLNPEEAKAWGLIHDVQVELFPSGAELIPIHFQQVSSNAGGT
jgi:ATP-dependent Clp protease protease subunit